MGALLNLKEELEIIQKIMIREIPRVVKMFTLHLEFQLNGTISPNTVAYNQDSLLQSSQLVSA